MTELPKSQLIKPQLDPITHLLESLKMKKKTKLTIPSFHKHVEQLEIVCIVGGNAKCTGTLEKSWAVFFFFCKIKHTLTIQFRNLSPRYVPKRNEKVCSHNTCKLMFIVALPAIAKNWKTRIPSNVNE